MPHTNAQRILDPSARLTIRARTKGRKNTEYFPVQPPRGSGTRVLATPRETFRGINPETLPIHVLPIELIRIAYSYYENKWDRWWKYDL